MTGIEAARDVLEQALAQRASDVHLEPTDHGSRVRFRVDGVMHERFTFDKADGLHVASALKALAQIDVAERRKAQDGRFRVRTKTGCRAGPAAWRFRQAAGKLPRSRTPPNQRYRQLL